MMHFPFPAEERHRNAKQDEEGQGQGRHGEEERVDDEAAAENGSAVQGTLCYKLFSTNQPGQLCNIWHCE